MPTIGDTLREARMRQRLDIADVEARTKIRAKYLRALENEEFGMLPGPTFVKTFLRSYAEVLGLDPHRLVEDYRARYEPREEAEALKPIGPPGPARDPRPRRPRRVALRIDPEVETYVCLDRGAGTEVFFEQILTEPQTFRGRRLRVNLGNTSVAVTKNGEPVDVGSGPNPVGFEFTPGSTTPVPLGERPCI